MIPFRERNQFTVGAIGLAIAALLMVGAFRAQDLPIVGGGTTYRAAFTEAGGLKPNDLVTIAGVKIGNVKSVDLAGEHVVVAFRVSDSARLGDRTRAAIRVKTVLGAKYVELQSQGPGQLKPGSEIPLTRTVAAYDVVDAFTDLSTTVEKIDTRQLATAMDTIATTFKDSPAEVETTLRGLSRLSQTIASRDEKLRELLGHAKGVSGVLSARNKEFVALLRDGDLLLRELRARREVIHELLTSTADMAAQMTALVAENKQQLTPTLDRLHNVVRILRKHQDDLDRALRLEAAYARLFTNSVGNGPWFDALVANVPPGSAAPVGEAVPQP